MLAWMLTAALLQAPQADVMTVARGTTSDISVAKEAVVRTSAEWTALWAAHGGANDAPIVDFSSEMVLAVFLGLRPTGGFGVEIVRAVRDGDVMTVEYQERAPGPGLLVAQVITYPFHIVKLPRHDGDVRFRKLVDPAAR